MAEVGLELWQPISRLPAGPPLFCFKHVKFILTLYSFTIGATFIYMINIYLI